MSTNGGYVVMHAYAHLSTSQTGSRLHVWLAAMAFFCNMRVFSDDELSAGSSEEEDNVWNKVLALRCHFHVGPCKQAHLTDMERGRLALLCHLALDIFWWLGV